jgi:hypothetical protein
MKKKGPKKTEAPTFGLGRYAENNRKSIAKLK